MNNVLAFNGFEELNLEDLLSIDGGASVSEMYEAAAVVCGVVAAVAVCIPGGQGVATVAGATGAVCAGVSYVAGKLGK